MGSEAGAAFAMVVEVQVGAVIKLPGKRSGGVAGWGDGDCVRALEMGDPGESEWAAPEAKQAAKPPSLVVELAWGFLWLAALEPVVAVAEDAEPGGPGGPGSVPVPRLMSWSRWSLF